MSSLSASLWIAEQALQATQGALDVTANNIANASTPGYSREQAVLTEEVSNGHGGGVDLQQIQSIRDQVLSSSNRGRDRAPKQLTGAIECPAAGTGSVFQFDARHRS